MKRLSSLSIKKTAKRKTSHSTSTQAKAQFLTASEFNKSIERPQYRITGTAV